MLKRSLTETDGATNRQVIDKIRNWKSEKPIPIHFYTTKFWQGNGVIGYTYPSDPTIYLNASYRAKYVWSDFAEASNEMHEILGHKVGFDHPMSCGNGKCDSTVPYSLNRAMEACTKDDIIKP